MTERKAAYNTGFASGGVTCKLGALCFYSSSVQVDSFVLRNPPERKARKRWLPSDSLLAIVISKPTNPPKIINLITFAHSPEAINDFAPMPSFASPPAKALPNEATKPPMTPPLMKPELSITPVPNS